MPAGVSRAQLGHFGEVSALPVHVTDVSETAWIAARLAPSGSCVGGLSRWATRRTRASDCLGWQAPARDNGLSPDVLPALCEIVGARGPVEDCWFAVSEGYGWVQGASILLVATDDPAVADAMRARGV